MTKVGFSPGIQGWFSICKSISVINHINKEKSENHIKSTNADKAFDRFQHAFMIKNFQQNGKEEIYLTIVKATCAKQLTLYLVVKN